jgi:hypothetical protein
MCHDFLGKQLHRGADFVIFESADPQPAEPLFLANRIGQLSWPVARQPWTRPRSATKLNELRITVKRDGFFCAHDSGLAAPSIQGHRA